MRLLILSNSDLTKSFVARKHYIIKHLSKYFKIIIFNVRLYWKEKKEEYKNAPACESDTLLKNAKMITGYPIRVYDIYLSEALNLLPNIALLRKIIKNFNIRAIINFSHILLGAFSSLWRENDIPLIFDFLDYIPGQIGFSSQSKLPMKTISRKIATKLLLDNIRKSDLVVAVSEALCKYAQLAGAKNVYLVPNGVDLNSIYPVNKLKIRKKLGLREIDFVIGYIGGVHWLLNLEEIFKVIKYKPVINGKKVKLLIIGSGSHLPYFFNLAKAMGIKDKVIFLGRVSKKKLNEYISAIDVGLIPFKMNDVAFFSCPLKFYEYLACGKAVITTTIPIIKKMVIEKRILKNLVFFADDKDEFEEAISRIISDGERPSVREIRSLLKDYDWRNLTSKYLDIINAVIRRG